MFENMSASDRIEAAKKITKRVVDHTMYLLELHENNAIIVYSPVLAGQIPPSLAANAFNIFQRSMHQFEIVRLCTLWDHAHPCTESVPTVIELIDDAAVVEALAQDTVSHYANMPWRNLSPSEDPEIEKLIEESMRENQARYGDTQAQKLRAELRKAVADAREIMTSPKLESVMNMRHKHLAHSLSETIIEVKRGQVAPMKYGDETQLLNSTIPIVEALYCWVNGCGFSFEDSRKIDQRYAEALWTKCTFDIEKR